MSYNKILMLAAGLVVTALTSSNAYAVNCGISYYCYRSMTPGPAPEGSAILARRTAAASNRVSRVNSNNRRAQPAGANRTAAAPRTLQQRQAEARRREQQQQQQLAQRRRQAQQQEQQRLAQVRHQQQQRAAANRQQPARSRPQATRPQPPANARQRLIAQQRAAHQAQQRAAQQRAAQQRAAAQRRPAPAAVLATNSQQSCQTIVRKITELNRQAVLRSREQKNAQAQRLFKAVEQLKKEATNKKCPGV